MRKHKHKLKQISILDFSILRCDCGLTFVWDITEQIYKEENRK